MLTAPSSEVDRPPPFARRHLEYLLRLCLAAIIIGSFLPSETKQAIGAQVLVQGQPGRDWRHRFYHVASFGTAGLLVGLINQRSKRVFLSCGALLGLGAMIELTQSAWFGTEFEWWDIRDDAYGIVLFAAAGQRPGIRKAVVHEAAIGD